jgi:hypothetical protein
MSSADFQSFLPILGLGLLVAMAAIGGWIFTTWLRVKHGYPLDGTWGQSLYPKTGDAAMERIKLLSQENAQLRAELGSVKDRLATIERIVTDGSVHLDREIESLRSRAN